MLRALSEIANARMRERQMHHEARLQAYYLTRLRRTVVGGPVKTNLRKLMGLPNTGERKP